MFGATHTLDTRHAAYVSSYDRHCYKCKVQLLRLSISRERNAP